MNHDKYSTPVTFKIIDLICSAVLAKYFYENMVGIYTELFVFFAENSQRVYSG